MTAERYSLDANIIFYALDAGAGERHRIAMSVWAGMRHGPCMLAVQTLCETYWAVHRKRPQQIEPARRLLTLASERIPIVAAQASDFMDTITVQAGRPVHFWDALLASTLRRNGCKVLLTEDVQDRTRDNGLQYVNPFAMDKDLLEQFT